MDLFEISIFLAIFLILGIIVLFFKYIIKTLRSKSHMRIFNMEEYLPREEIQTLKQVFYLVMITLFLVDIFYQLTFNGNDLVSFTIYDICLCIVTISIFRLNNVKSYILAFVLLPFASMNFLFFNQISIIFIPLDILHFFALVYMLIYFYNKFMKYTKSNGLGFTILLLFSIIFFSFIWTSFVEHVNLLDSLVMVSNAFTSNGYAVLGNTMLGKINAIFLVWSGYVLSGVGTATLTVAILTRHYNKRFDELEELIKDLKNDD